LLASAGVANVRSSSEVAEPIAKFLPAESASAPAAERSRNWRRSMVVSSLVSIRSGYLVIRVDSIDITRIARADRKIDFGHPISRIRAS
jgi:hypothetical protein